MLNVARIDEQFGELDRALALQQQRLEIEEQLAKTHDSDDLQYNIAASLIGIGELKLWLGEYESALDYERRSLIMNQALLDRNPGSLKMLRGVWRSRGWTAMVLRYGKRSPRARPSLEKRSPSQSNSRLATRITLTFSGFLLPITRACVSVRLIRVFLPKCRNGCQKAISINQAMVRLTKVMCRQARTLLIQP